MNDRFKFRVWNKENNKYEADLTYEAGDLQVACVNKIFEEYISDGCIIEQCTGLKDMNGKLIYEGDIVKDDIGLIAPVCFDEINAMFYIDRYIGVYNYPFAYFYHYDSEKELEVIGNIHENTDLRKVGGK